MSETIHLDQLVDPFEAKVVVDRDASGAVVDARFDLAGLPRLDGMLAGKNVAGVPDLVKMLCGICPVAHHLAGVAALDALAGLAPPDLPGTARDQRLMLHHGSVLDSLASRFIGRDRDLAVRLRRVGKLAMKAAGAPGHFPDVAVPGGVHADVDDEALGRLGEELPPLRDAIRAVHAHTNHIPSPQAPTTHTAGEDRAGTTAPGPRASEALDFDGLDVAVVDADGAPDPLGGYVGMIGPGTDVVVAAAADWAGMVTETRPGAPDPRPVIDLGDGVPRPYRVGPLSRARFRAAGTTDPFLAQVLSVADSIDALSELRRSLDGAERGTSSRIAAPVGAGRGVGIVDGPRGLLMHEYVADEAGTVTSARILTPTAQNEGWLAGMLRASLAAASGDEREAWAESAIRAADPCLPCTSAPEGGMGIRLEEHAAGGPGHRDTTTKEGGR